jgi:FkbM family methyltransferase
MKETITRLAYALGPVFMPGGRLRGLALANRLRRVFADHDIDTVIDVGANLGQFRDFLRYRVGFKGQIDSFEPVPNLAERLRTRATADDRWSIHACALGARADELSINVTAAPVFSSFRTPLQVGSHQDAMNTITETALVPVSTLDAEFTGKRGLSRTYLKLDTQGFDLEVLRGGCRTIAEIPALQTEISFRPLYVGMPTYTESIAAFQQHGFAVADLFLVSADDAERAIEFDCLMVRDGRRVA